MWYAFAVALDKEIKKVIPALDNTVVHIAPIIRFKSPVRERKPEDAEDESEENGAYNNGLVLLKDKVFKFGIHKIFLFVFMVRYILFALLGS